MHKVALKSLEALIISLLSSMSAKDLKKVDCASKQNLATFLAAVGAAGETHPTFLAPELCAGCPTLRHITLAGQSEAKDVKDALAVIDPEEEEGESKKLSVLMEAFKMNVNGVALIEFAKEQKDTTTLELAAFRHAQPGARRRPL